MSKALKIINRIVDMMILNYRSTGTFPVMVVEIGSVEYTVSVKDYNYVIFKEEGEVVYVKDIHKRTVIALARAMQGGKRTTTVLAKIAKKLSTKELLDLLVAL